MICAYVGRDSVAAGQSLWLHVSTTSRRFRVDFVRHGRALVRMGGSDWLPGRDAPAPPHPDGIAGCANPAADWSWPGHEFAIGSDWPPGIYVAELVEERAPHPRSGCDQRNGTIVGHREYFIVRARTPGSVSAILYKVATFTRHAYNNPCVGEQRGSSLYDDPVYVPPSEPGEPFGHKVSMRRPGAARHFMEWDLPFVGWLERNGYSVEYCADLDVHEDPALLDAYQLLLSVGHDEYWSQAMRSSVEAFVRGAGNVAFLSANTCWWRIHLVDRNSAFVADTDHKLGDDAWRLPATDQWWAPPRRGVGNPENGLTGVSFRNAGVWKGWFADDAKPHVGFTVQHADHWAFEGTGLRDGSDGGPADLVGAGIPLVGYECDGATYELDERGVAWADGRDGSPTSLLILGVAVLEPFSEDFYAPHTGIWSCPPREPDASSPRAATMAIHTAGGTVFTAATTNWPVILGQDADPTVDRITRNVLDRLAQPNAPDGPLGR